MPKYLPPPHKFRPKTLDSTDTVDFTHFRRTVNRYCVNDLPLYTNNVSTDLYADDTTLYMIGETQDYIEQNLQIALQNLSEWCKLNGMLLNTEKTKAMLITTSQKRLHLHNDILLLTYNNDALNSVENEKVLGVRIDNNLTWSIHINFIAKKISSNLWLLSKLKDYLSTEHRVQFYKTYIQPHILQYGEEHLNII